jgi:tRNA threonylcarbamoyladenosine biosynthesis protein TsaB
MRVLALDASTENCSVALFTGREAIARSAELPRGHADEILRMLDALLGEAGVSLGMLDGIAAGIGPGGFTGVRISVSVAQGLAFGAGLGVVPVTTLDALALKAVEGGAERVLACLDARMGEVYWGTFAADAALGTRMIEAIRVGPAARVVLPEAGRFAGIGRGFTAYPELARLPGLDIDATARLALPDAREMAMLGALRLGSAVDPADLAPLYVRDKVALTEAERHHAK